MNIIYNYDTSPSYKITTTLMEVIKNILNKNSLVYFKLPGCSDCNKLDIFLKEKGVPSMIYYPIPLYDQEAFAGYHDGVRHSHTEQLCREVISFPIHTEMEIETQSFIIATIKSFFRL